VIVLGVPLLVRYFADAAGDEEFDSIYAGGEACALPRLAVALMLFFATVG
jgi:hypothetical protein